MKKYEILYEVKRDDESSYVQVPVVGNIEQNEAFGDQIGIYKDGGVLEFDEFLDLDDEDVQSFIKDTFIHPKAVCGFIRKITE